MLLAACASRPAPEPTTPAPEATTPGPTENVGETVEAALLGAWKQDHEQSTDGVEVFVRENVELPPARYRQHWTFESGGVLRTSALAANDAHGVVDGRWRLVDSELVLEVPGEPEEQVWVIVEVGETLRVRRAE